MPASTVMGVMGSASSTSGGPKSGHRGKWKSFSSTPDRKPSGPGPNTYESSARWNVWGSNISDFGNPFRRSK